MNLPQLHTQADRFQDKHGRQVLLRGINLGGDSKVPYPNGGTQYPDNFSKHRDVSFIGRPFPLEEADEHLSRIRNWGFNCLRLLVTWEAVEHSGPGQYDIAYLEYFADICRKAGEYGLYVFVDFHQDVWSRMSGGDGAPGWTFEAVGLDIERFGAADAAHVMQYRYDYDAPDSRQEGYAPMSWAQNYSRPVNGIMWTLFWAGKRVTPNFLIDGVNVQEYLQGHLLNAMEQVALRIRQLPNVIGFDSLNEPGVGWLGQTLSPFFIDGVRKLDALPIPGLVWSPLEALAVARGVSTTIPVREIAGISFTKNAVSEQTMNSAGVRIWRDGVACPFEQAGIYALVDGQAVAKEEEAFAMFDGHPLNFSEDVLKPFYERVAQTFRKHAPHWMLFAEMDPFGAHFGRSFPRQMPSQSVNASHWYDLMILVGKQFDPALAADILTGQRTGERDAIAARFLNQMAHVKTLSERVNGGMPTLIGEFGIPYDLNHRAAYVAWTKGQRDDTIWQAHTLLLEMMYEAIDSLQLSTTQWNYTAGNSNDQRVGDQWNMEDLSIYSRDQVGGRAELGFCRPFARALQGRLLSMRFQREPGVFELAWEADPAIEQPTEVYLPRLQYPDGVSITAQGPVSIQKHDEKTQLLHIWASDHGVVRLECSRAPTH